MMGRQEAVPELFYDFRPDDHVPADYMLRDIDRFLDLSALRAEHAPFYSSIGRPSIDPDLMIRILVIGYSTGIRSERRLCEEVHLNLAYRWFRRFGLNNNVPNRSTFSRNRHGRFRDSDILRRLFESVVARCLTEGLVGSEGFAADASLIAADANRQRSVPGDHYDSSAAKEAGRAVQEYMARRDDAAFGAASEVTPKFISSTDPAAQWTGALKGPAFFAYATNYLIDTENAMILDVEATRATRQAEVGASRTMLDRVEERWGLKPEWIAADSAYGSAANLAWLVKEKQIAPHIPVFGKSQRTDGTWSREDFTWDGENDRYICPEGKELVQYHRSYATPRTGIDEDGCRRYRATKKDCSVCPSQPVCCPNAPARKIPRDLNEDSRDVARAIAKTPGYERSQHRRKKVEMLFAHLKRILHLGRLRLRGPLGARDEFLLAATAQNLRKLTKFRPLEPRDSMAMPA